MLYWKTSQKGRVEEIESGCCLPFNFVDVGGREGAELSEERTCEDVPAFSVTLVLRRDFLERIIIDISAAIIVFGKLCTHVHCGLPATSACDANGDLHPRVPKVPVYKLLVMLILPSISGKRFSGVPSILLHLYDRSKLHFYQRH